MFQKIFISFLLLFSNLPAQWTRTEGVNSSFINTAHFSGDNIFVGSDSLYISTDRGNTWLTYKIPQLQSYEITSLIQVNDLLFAGTFGSGVYKSADMGTTWTEFSEGLSSWGKYPVIFLLSGDTLFTATDGGGFYYRQLHSSGIWTQFNEGLPSNYAWTVKSFARTSTGFIAGSGISGFYYVRERNADQWTEMTIDNSGRHGLTPNDLISSGDTVYAATAYGIYRSPDNGVHWDSVGISALPLNCVSLARLDNRIFAGFRRSADFFIWYSDDAGNTWNSLDHQFFYLMDLYAYDGKLWAATDDGLRYSEINLSLEEEIFPPAEFALYQNYPNPFNSYTQIKYSIPYSGSVLIRVYDILGTEISILLDEYKEAGTHSIGFNAENLPSGIYFLSFANNDFNAVKKMVLMK